MQRFACGLLAFVTLLGLFDMADADEKIEVKVYREIVEVLCPGDRTLLDDIVLALKQPDKYLAKFDDELYERGIEDPKEVDVWLALIDGLESRNCLADVDWKNSGADLAWNFNQLSISKQRKLDWRGLEKAGPDYKTTPEFADEIERVLKSAGLIAVFLVYSGDSYALCFVESSKVKALQQSAHRISQRIEIFDKDAGDI